MVVYACNLNVTNVFVGDNRNLVCLAPNTTICFISCVQNPKFIYFAQLTCSSNSSLCSLIRCFSFFFSQELSKLMDAAILFKLGHSHFAVHQHGSSQRIFKKCPKFTKIVKICAREASNSSLNPRNWFFVLNQTQPRQKYFMTQR